MASQILADRYEIIEEIGQGGMGVVYKARHVLMNRIVAIKMLHESLIVNELARKRFEQEAQAISALNHPNILTVYDFGITEDNKPFLVVEFLEGTTMEKLLQDEGRLASNRAVLMFLQIASGMAHAHEKGVIHRDIKPSNFMIVKIADQDDFVKIVDFGIAKLIQEGKKETIGLTTTGEVFGSPLYMSPEQCRGRVLDARSDIYSFGCVMYKVLTGLAPFPAQDVPECLYKHVHEMPPPFAEAVPDLQIDPRLEEITFKSMGKEPEDRFQTMVELRQALETFAWGGSMVQTAGGGIVPPQSINPFLLSSQPVLGQAKELLATQPIAKEGVWQSMSLRKRAVVCGSVAAVCVGSAFAYWANNNPERQVQELLKQGGQFYDKHDYAKAETALTSALSKAQKISGAGHLQDQAADALYKSYFADNKFDRIVLLALQDGQYAQAASLLSQGLENAQQKFGAQSKEAAMIMSPLAKLYEKQGNYTKAEELYSTALRIKSGKATDTKESMEAQELKANLEVVKKHHAEAERLQAERVARAQRAAQAQKAAQAASKKNKSGASTSKNGSKNGSSKDKTNGDQKPQKKGVLKSVGNGFKKIFGIFGHKKKDSDSPTK